MQVQEPWDKVCFLWFVTLITKAEREKERTGARTPAPALQFLSLTILCLYFVASSVKHSSCVKSFHVARGFGWLVSWYIEYSRFKARTGQYKYNPSHIQNFKVSRSNNIKGTGEINFSNIFYLTQYIQNIITSKRNQYKTYLRYFYLKKSSVYFTLTTQLSLD